jgi:hypothetical protein
MRHDFGKPAATILDAFERSLEATEIVVIKIGPEVRP